MRVIDQINSGGSTKFSIEILPPLKGNDIRKIFKTIDQLVEFDPKFINITSHRSEFHYVKTPNGTFERRATRKRPGSVAVAAAILNRYHIPVVPHMICSGFTKSETEYALIDLNYLGIYDILCLQGDKPKNEPYNQKDPEFNAHAIDLINQVNDFNNGRFLDGTVMEPIETHFSYGVAGYPEKHEEAPNMESDIYWLKKKVDAGAEYIVTQMFFDNKKYFEFVDLCRKSGINVPIIPGLKPLRKARQLNILPKTFHTDIPEDLAKEVRNCKNDDQVVELGIEWCAMQANEMKKAGVPVVHFYTLMATQSVKKVAQMVF